MSSAPSPGRSALKRWVAMGVVALLLAAPVNAQFDLFNWTLQDDAGDGITSVSSDTMWVVANWVTLGGGSILAYKGVAPVNCRITVDMWYMTFDGACGTSVPVFLLNGNATTLATCSSSQTLVLTVPAGAEFGLGLKTFDGTFPGSVQFTDFQFDPIPSFESWTDLGQGLAGAAGIPALTGISLLYPHFPFTLDLADGPASAPVVMVVGFSSLNAPFKGGVMVPSPDVLITGLSTNASGELQLSAGWPGGVPSGFQFFLQAWMPDVSGPFGFSASNALRAQTP
ncbi:MAG: hypothetical protein ACT4PU_04130 [Planctomycetota bacterium]